MKTERRRRLIIYSHDTYGLGHLRRNLLIAEHLLSRRRSLSVLLLTGSPRTQAYRLPQGCDTVKLPAVTKAMDGRYRTRTLGVPLDGTLAIRAELIRGAARAFAPDLVLVDHAPVGVHGELRGLFDDLLRLPRRPRLVLGLRDVIDEAAAVRNEWARLGVDSILAEVYDRILVYGDPRVTSTAEELGLCSKLPAKVAFTGYLARPMPLRRRDPSERPLIVVTGGGGGDAHHVLRPYLQVLQEWKGITPFESVLVTGPLLSRDRQREVRRSAMASGQPVRVLGFTDRMETLIADADAVVTMGGYNSVVEVLACGVPAFIVPRVTPRREQAIRARRLAAPSDLEFREPAADVAERMERFVRDVLERPRRVPRRFDLDGLARLACEVDTMLDDEPADEDDHIGARPRVTALG